MPTETLPTEAATHSLNVIDLILGAGIIVQLVMLGLLLASIYSWYLIAKLNISFKQANKQDQQFEKIFWSGAELPTLFKNAQTKANRAGLENVFHDGYSEYHKLSKRKATLAQSLEGTERILRVSLSREQAGLEHGLSTLASIGSVAPYVGLFGTVWGIMTAFIGLSSAEQVTLATVAPGIAEALIATAIGLFAAIPAVLAFNHFTAKSEGLYEERALFAEEMTARLQRQSLAPDLEDEV
ncbi:Cell division and transport-associated protein TolQ [Acinetobacter marinus]|uniref:Tol-Pal system protein TolQ n=1 Tax=Acinetobacter marinus TaxID=281375 RepID=A0A1G6KT22_9GAMM|nr:protein TolQ [Acinetobacter marinus]SDC34252.1 Cell division and transport-associated protein TolQ [Acinetobacter marinus]